MNLHITLDDLATLVTTKEAFKKGVAEEAKKYINELENNIMALKDQLAELKTAVADQTVAIKTEFDEVKAKFEAQQAEIDTLEEAVDALEAKLDEFEGLDASAEVQAIKDSIAKINEISESDVPPADTTPPAIPTDLAATNVTANGVDLSWVADSDAVAFEVFQDGTKVGDATSNNFSVSGLTAETAYAFSVAAKDAAGNTSSQSDSVSVTTTA